MRDVVLIGPTGVGKSTVAALLGKRFGLPVVSLDSSRFEYYDEIGYDPSLAARLRTQSFEDLIRYWERYNAHAVERCLASHSGVVFDFGAVHSVYEDSELFAKVAMALSDRYVAYLLPSPDPAESVRMLHERGREGTSLSQDELAMWWRILERFVNSPCNKRLANLVIYTQGLSPEDVASRVAAAHCKVA